MFARSSMKPGSGWVVYFFIFLHTDSDSSLVSNENFSESLWPSGWVLGQATRAKMTLKLLELCRQSQKNPYPPTKKIFSECNPLDWPIHLSR